MRTEIVPDTPAAPPGGPGAAPTMSGAVPGVSGDVSPPGRFSATAGMARCQYRPETGVEWPRKTNGRARGRAAGRPCVMTSSPRSGDGATVTPGEADAHLYSWRHIPREGRGGRSSSGGLLPASGVGTSVEEPPSTGCPGVKGPVPQPVSMTCRAATIQSAGRCDNPGTATARGLLPLAGRYRFARPEAPERRRPVRRAIAIIPPRPQLC